MDIADLNEFHCPECGQSHCLTFQGLPHGAQERFENGILRHNYEAGLPDLPEGEIGALTCEECGYASPKATQRMLRSPRHMQNLLAFLHREIDRIHSSAKRRGNDHRARAQIQKIPTSKAPTECP